MTRTLTIPLGYRLAQPREIALQIPDLPLTAPEWAVLMTVLQAMKPALVEPALAEPALADARIASPLELTPDEAIEVALVLRAFEAISARGVEPGAARITDRATARGVSLVELADRLDAHERDTDA